ncbi:glycyl-radical enzyme activating protein [Acutalibacter sp. 1XD8-36]|uniref:glycyl-radical enzyme activating protein n=1 Tax=Acutalibacter sp. 1XD8-36 TaxID=2320852 RepID=UPI001412A846|nr:glycyl-radical enzyme activating protein [Acutalibacter sp. 1XD8-36]NBJ90114.1 glycyl-radical enzyme activating protein [Acutalibacter sp. 1XD8-36]
MKGIITEIERFSLRDGPGIRTTVFLKGCNMACKWCHNPETLQIKPQLMVYPEKCLGCGACVRVCPSGARTIKDGALHYSRAICTGCGACANDCFTGALILSGREMTVEEVMEEILQDRAYYKNSGGGVTLSGGELTTQPEFARALLETVKAEGISTALETNMHAPWHVYESLLPLVDLVMFDIKIFDCEAHRKWTGVSNERVLENARKLAKTGKDFLVRTPVIPGVNDSQEEIGNIAEFAGSLGGAQYYELLLFNPLGESKYQALQTDNHFEGASPSPVKTADRLKQIAEERSGMPVRVG